jgi:hypothetical protein
MPNDLIERIRHICVKSSVPPEVMGAICHTVRESFLSETRTHETPESPQGEEAQVAGQATNGASGDNPGRCGSVRTLADSKGSTCRHTESAAPDESNRRYSSSSDKQERIDALEIGNRQLCRQIEQLERELADTTRMHADLQREVERLSALIFNPSAAATSERPVVPQADAWVEICNVLDEVHPGWDTAPGKHLVERAVNAIRCAKSHGRDSESPTTSYDEIAAFDKWYDEFPAIPSSGHFNDVRDMAFAAWLERARRSMPSATLPRQASDAMYKAGLAYVTARGTAWCVNDLWRVMYDAAMATTERTVRDQ